MQRGIQCLREPDGVCSCRSPWSITWVCPNWLTATWTWATLPAGPTPATS